MREGELREKESAGTRKRKLGRARRARRRTYGSSERERQLAAFSRDDAPNRRRAAPCCGRLGFPRGGGKTRLVSLSLITILCVVVDDEGRRRASGPVYRQQERSGQCACVPAPCRVVRAQAHAHVASRRDSPLFYISFSLARLSFSFSLLFIPLPLSPRPSPFPPFVFIRTPAPPECQGACLRRASSSHASPQRSMSTRCHASA